MVRILALNDDNHDTSFVMDNGETFGYARNLIEFLMEPHSETYEIKGFALVDYEGPAAELDECLVDRLFSFLNGYGKQPEGYTFEQAFDALWTSATEWWH